MKNSEFKLNIEIKHLHQGILTAQDAGSRIISIIHLPYLWYITDVISILYKKGNM